MNDNIHEYRYENVAQAAHALARSIAARLDEAIAARGTALLAVSGGRSPAAVFDALQGAPLAWHSVIVAQVDERWVAPEHADSNALLVRTHLLHGPAAAARFIAMKNDADTPYVGQKACEAALAALPRPFDITLLGMGEDGHTASLFPGAEELHRGLTSDAFCLAVTPPAAPHARMSLTLKGLLDSRVLILQIAGAAKEQVYRLALEAGAIEEMPIRAVLRQHAVPVEVWISS